MDIRRYNNIKVVPKEFKKNKVKPFLPNLSEEDYKSGSVRRFFTQKANDKNSVVYEISENAYSSFRENPLYITTSVNWRISGTNDEIKKINEKVIRYASKTMPALQLYLPNLLQFSKNNLGE